MRAIPALVERCWEDKGRYGALKTRASEEADLPALSIPYTFSPWNVYKLILLHQCDNLLFIKNVVDLLFLFLMDNEG